jgi:hypothetical protein
MAKGETRRNAAASTAAILNEEQRITEIMGNIGDLLAKHGK